MTMAVEVRHRNIPDGKRSIMADSLFEASSSSSSVPADCRYGIRLVQDISIYEVEGRAQAWRMRITVTDYYGLDPNIFLYLRTGPDARGVLVDTFECVASPVDISEYPAGTPDEDQDPPFYRLAEVDLLSRNRNLLDETWELIKSDRDELVRTLAAICELEENEVSDYGYLPTDTPESTPVLPDSPGSSSGPDECPNDPYVVLVVTESNDPDFPVDTELVESDSMLGPPSCLRTWSVTGGITGKVLELETTLPLHNFTAYLDNEQVDSGGLGDGYNAYLYFNGFVLRIEGA